MKSLVVVCICLLELVIAVLGLSVAEKGWFAGFDFKLGGGGKSSRSTQAAEICANTVANQLAPWNTHVACVISDCHLQERIE